MGERPPRDDGPGGRPGMANARDNVAGAAVTENLWASDTHIFSSDRWGVKHFHAFVICPPEPPTENDCPENGLVAM